MSGLPAGWALASIDQVAEVLDHLRQPINNTERSARLQASTGKTYPYFGATGQAGLIDDFVFDEDLVLLGEDGVPFLDPAKAKAYRVSGPCWVNNHAHVLRVRPDVADWRLACHALNALDYTDLVTGSTRLKLTQEAMKRIQLSLAPRAEQQRIADKLEAVLGRVDACRDHLDRVGPLLKRFRQSVLAAAASGRLSAAWRAEPNEVDPSALPTSWSVCQVKDAGKIQLGRQRAPKFHHGDRMAPYLRVQNVFEDRLDLSDVMSMDFAGMDFERYQLHPGDILLNEGQSPQFLGRPAMYRGEMPGVCFTNSLIRFQPKPHVDGEFALLVFRHHMHSGRYVAEGTITTNIAHLSAGRFSSVEFPLPPLDEQREIVMRAKALLALADRMEARLATAANAAKRLVPSVLAKAFRGELVPQDPADEPAQALLDRLRAARASEPPGRRRRQPAGHNNT